MKTKSTNVARTSSLIREELEEKRAIAARLPAIIDSAAREHAVALEEFDKERGLAALERKRKASADLETVQRDLALLEAELIETETKEIEEARQRRYDDAKARAEAARDTFVKRYPELAGEITNMLRDIANADLAIAAVNEDLPQGGTELQQVSKEIFSTIERRVDIGEEEFEQWIRRDQSHSPETAPPLEPNYERYIQQEDGRFFVRRPEGLDFEVVKVKLVRRTYLPAVHHHGDGFARQLHLPGLAHGHPFFQPTHDESAESILAAMRVIESRMTLVEPGRKPHAEILTPEQARRQPLKRAA